LAEFYTGKYRQRLGLNCIAEYYQGLSYYGLKAYPRSQLELAQSLKVCAEPYYSRTLYWSGLGLFRTGNYENARKSFEKITADSLKHSDALAALNAIDVVEHMPRKSSRKAGILNLILPGSGYAYAGYPQTGLASFLTVGLFTWGTIAAAQHGETALAVILGSLNLAWYFGGVQGAANAATRTNEGRVNAVMKPLE
jgi:tetratricopeptide (TPR) repeat protein